MTAISERKQHRNGLLGKLDELKKLAQDIPLTYETDFDKSVGDMVTGIIELIDDCEHELEIAHSPEEEEYHLAEEQLDAQYEDNAIWKTEQRIPFC